MKIKVLTIYLAFIFTIVLQNIYFIGFNQFFLFSIIATSLILLEKEKRIYFLFFMIPFRSSLPFNLINIFIFFLILFTSKIKYSRMFILALVIIIIEVFTAIESNNIFDSVRFLTTLLTVFLIAKLPSKHYYISGKKLAFYYSLGFVISGLLYLIVFSSFFNIHLLFNGQLRLGSISPQLIEIFPNYNYFLNYNANEIGINSIFSMIFLIYNFRKSIGFYIFFLLSFILGILTFSRTFFLCLFVLLIYLFFRFFKKFAFFSKVIFLTSVFSMIIIFLNFFNFEVFRVIYDRFLSSSSDLRIEILIGYYNNWDFSNAFFGKGAINYIYFYNQEFSMHNGFFEIFLSYGFFGIILFLTTLFYLWRMSKNDNLMKVTILIFILSILFHQFLGSTQLIYIFSIFLILVKNLIYNSFYAYKHLTKKYLSH